METVSKFATIAYASLGLSLGWLAAIVGFCLLACGIAGAIVGQIIWTVGSNVIAATRYRLKHRAGRREGPARGRYA